MDRFSLGVFPDFTATFSLSLVSLLVSLFSALAWSLAAFNNGAQFLSNIGATVADLSLGLRSQRSDSRMALL